jgi:hypothetical protein
MHTFRSLLGIACRIAALSFLLAATTSLTQAQQPSPVPSLMLASEAAPASPASVSSSSSASSSDAMAADSDAALDSSQPPPRRYGRPNFSNKTSNSDGSAKYEFLGGFGVPLPVGDTHIYETPSWGLQVGGGRNFNKNLGVILQFDYDHFGLQAATINNQTYIYNYPNYEGSNCTSMLAQEGYCIIGLDGNNHVWSFTLNPAYTLRTQGFWAAYAVVGGGFYHKVTNFTQPATEEQCGTYGCGYFSVTSTLGHYTSNAGGVNGGFGVTRKFSQSSNARFYVEARYVLVLNQPRNGVTAANVSTAPASATNLYPANSHRTTYIPIKLGIRF